MNPWEALANPPVERPGHAYTESVKRKKPSPAKPRAPSGAGEVVAAALVFDGCKARLVPIYVTDFYARATA